MPDESSNVQFRFDKTAPLGMIAPIWSGFNATQHVDETTMLCFQIPQPDHRNKVLANLSELRPELLLFLRQLRRIDVTILSDTGSVDRKFQICRTDGERSMLRTITLVCESTSPTTRKEEEHFLVFQRTIPRMPYEPKREGVLESDILIALPIDDSATPILRDRPTFNFLPIRNYGLPFVLQADFMLIANREDILQQQSRWNTALIEATLELFVDSVRQLNQQNLLKYGWPKYLKSHGNASGTAFSGFLNRVVNRLRAEPIIESQATSMQRPADLTVVPIAFTDGARPPNPLLLGPNGLRGFAHTSYAPSDLDNLRICALTANEFVNMLRCAAKQAREFRQCPARWHGMVAHAITSQNLIHRVTDLELIPLRTRAWSRSRPNEIFFPELGGGLHIPSGIEAAVVDDEAQTDAARKALFRALGVVELKATKVCDLILKQHSLHGADYGEWTVEDVVGHAYFMYASHVRLSGTNGRSLRLASRNSELLHLAHDLYMDVPGDAFQVSVFLGRNCDTAKFLHGDYFTCTPAGSSLAWIEWLQNTIGVQTKPKFVGPDGLSPEFEHVILNSRKNEWLIFLVDHWRSYSNELRYVSKKTRDRLNKAKVLCSDGELRELGSVYLANSEVTAEPLANTYVAMIAVDNPSTAGWHELASIGLRTAPDLDLYMEILSGLRTGARDHSSLTDVKRIYSGIQLHAGGGQAFRQARL